jgi:hypothetical protein
MRNEDNLFHRLRHGLLITLVAVVLLSVTLPGLAQVAKQGEGAASEPGRETEAFNLRSEACIYGYPLVIMEILRSVMTNVTAPEGFHAPLGQIAHMRQYPDASFRGAAIPNRDLLYSFAWLDLSKEPYILSLPDEHGRYYLIEMLDAWTNVFAAPGKRTTGTKAQKYLITAPGWHGTLPRGLKQIKSPTNMVWLIGRTYCTGTPADYQKVSALQDKYTLIPLSAYGKRYAPPKGTVDPKVDMRTSAWEQVNRLDGAAFFKIMADAMQANPPAPQDTPMVAKLAKIGLVPGQGFDAAKLDPALAQGLNDSFHAALEKIRAYGKDTVSLVNGWSFTLKTGVYGTDYLQRAAIAMVDLGANRPQDIIEMTVQKDAAGELLDGSHRYVLHFPKSQIPPAHDFWSLTLYNAEHFLVANPLNRYNLNSRSKFRHNRDGSLDLYIQKDSPGKDKESNWLPAPANTFELMLRLYWPKESVLKGTWKPPAVTRLN